MSVEIWNENMEYWYENLLLNWSTLPVIPSQPLSIKKKKLKAQMRCLYIFLGSSANSTLKNPPKVDKIWAYLCIVAVCQIWIEARILFIFN